MNRRELLLAGAGGAFLPVHNAAATVLQASELIGRWDLTVREGAVEYPSWLEVELSGRSTLVGLFVARTGSARPISEIKLQGDAFSFTIPRQWEGHSKPIEVSGKLSGGRLSGTVPNGDGTPVPFVGQRAPGLIRSAEPAWGSPIEMFDGKSLAGWKTRWKERPNGWEVKGGAFINSQPGNDLLTERTFMDFRIQVEFKLPPGSNSGLYLRGRYEVQIEDNFGKPASSHGISGVYGFLKPRVNAAKPAGEWQTLDATLLGREVSVKLNGVEVISRQEIPGITGGALDSHEGEPGPILLQGDHGVVEYRRVTVTPAR